MLLWLLPARRFRGIQSTHILLVVHQLSLAKSAQVRYRSFGSILSQFSLDWISLCRPQFIVDYQF